MTRIQLLELHICHISFLNVANLSATIIDYSSSSLVHGGFSWLRIRMSSASSIQVPWNWNEIWPPECFWCGMASDHSKRRSFRPSAPRRVDPNPPSSAPWFPWAKRGILLRVSPRKMVQKPSFQGLSVLTCHCFNILQALNIPPGGKLNPRFVCSWRSYARHWMRNAWFWQTIQFMIFAVPLCFVFFLAFCNVFCIHELPKSASFFCSFLEICRF